MTLGLGLEEPSAAAREAGLFCPPASSLRCSARKSSMRAVNSSTDQGSSGSPEHAGSAPAFSPRKFRPRPCSLSFSRLHARITALGRSGVEKFAFQLAPPYYSFNSRP